MVITPFQRACTTCRQAKVKCRPHGTDVSACARCTSRNITCSTTEMQQVIRFCIENSRAKHNSERARRRGSSSTLHSSQYTTILSPTLNFSPMSESLKVTLEQKAIARVFVDWSPPAGLQDAQKGYVEDLHSLYYAAPADNPLRLIVEALGFAAHQEQHDSEGLSFGVLARRKYGAALRALQTSISHYPQAMSASVKAALILIENFEVLHSFNTGLGPHSAALQYIVGSSTVFSDAAQESEVELVVLQRLLVRHVCYGETPSPFLSRSLRLKDASQLQVRLTLDVLNMSSLIAYARSLTGPGLTSCSAKECQDTIDDISRMLVDLQLCNENPDRSSTSLDCRIRWPAGISTSVADYLYELESNLADPDDPLLYDRNVHHGAQIFLREAIIDLLLCIGAKMGRDLDERESTLLLENVEAIQHLCAALLSRSVALLGLVDATSNPYATQEGTTLARFSGLCSLWFLSGVRSASKEQRRLAQVLQVWVQNHHSMV